MSTVQGTLAKGIQLLEKFIVSISNPEINRIDIWIKPDYNNGFGPFSCD